MSAVSVNGDDVKFHVSDWIGKEGPSYVPATMAAILELADRLYKIESDFRTHIHHTLNQDAVVLPVLPDPLSEWKALEPGRKVLNKISKRVWSIVSFSERGNCYQLVDPENKEVGTSLGSSHEDFENNYQILHEGPFDAGKLKVGDWVWNIPLDKWVTFEGYADQCNIVPIFKDPETGNRYCYDYLSRYTHSFSPPAPPSREERIEKATEKIWHLIDRAANQSTVAKEEARAILIELMEEKP